jgi:hypothetical protein
MIVSDLDLKKLIFSITATHIIKLISKPLWVLSTRTAYKPSKIHIPTETRRRLTKRDCLESQFLKPDQKGYGDLLFFIIYLRV